MREQITDKMYMGEPVKDDRPLTDEVLQELGFEKVISEYAEWWEYHIAKDFTLGSYPDYKYKDGVLIENQYNVTILKSNESIGIRYATVGKLKILISALKGDE